MIAEIEAKDYTVFIGSIEESSLQEFVTSNYRIEDTFVLVDEHTNAHCWPTLDALFGDRPPSKIVISSGEAHKNLDALADIARQLNSANASRNALLINLGGGVISDIGGFTASIYKRGVDFINIPTTLLAQVDASVGGKVGVDLDDLKNYLGVFNNPKAVFVDPVFLRSLPDRELASGFAEVIKHGLIMDQDYVNLIKEHSVDASSDWTKIILRSIGIKNQVVLGDPTENGDRKKLNFGHTVGHAIETFYLRSNQVLLHGEAIAVGMICESYISSKVSGLEEVKREYISKLILTHYSKVSIDSGDFNSIVDLMRADKKNQSQRINFTLLTGIGSSIVDQEAPEELIVESLNYYTAL